MGNIDWKNVLLTVYHAGLVLGAAYAASHQQWAWAVPALTSLAGLSTAPTWALSVLSRATPSGQAEITALKAELEDLKAKVAAGG